MDNTRSEQSRKRAPATRATPAQLSVLRNVFCHSPSPSSQMCKTMAGETGLPFKWISQWFGRQRIKGRKSSDSAPNPRSRTGSITADSLATSISPQLASRSTAENFSGSNLSTLSNAEISQVKTEQEDVQSIFSNSGFITETVAQYTAGAPSSADPSCRQPARTNSSDNARDAYSSSKNAYMSKNVNAGGAYIPPSGTDSHISHRMLSTIAPPKRSSSSSQSTTKSVTMSSYVQAEATFVPLDESHSSSTDYNSADTLAISAERKAVEAIRSAHSPDKTVPGSPLLQIVDAPIPLKSKGTRISRSSHTKLLPLTPLQPGSMQVRPEIVPQSDGTSQGAPSRASYPGAAISLDSVDTQDFPGISKPVDLEAVNPSRAPLKHLTHLLEGYKAENGTYVGLLIAVAVPSYRQPLIDCLTGSALIPFEAAMGLSLLSRLGLL